MPLYPPAGGGTTVNGSTGGISTLLMTQVGRMDGFPSLTKSGTVTGTAGFGSSLFLQRITIPAPMSLTEIDVAMRIRFNATSNGAGTMSRSFALYSFGNSSSLATVCSASGTSAWITGTVTAGAATSLTQYQDGWHLNALGVVPTPIIQPFTFAATSFTGREYVVAQLFDFAQASSTWTVQLFGGIGPNSTLQPQMSLAAASGITGTAAASAFTATTGTALTAWSAAASALTLNKVASTAALTTAAGSSILATATAASTASLLLNTGTGGFGLLSSAGLSAGSIVTGVTAGSIVTLSTDNFTFLSTIVPAYCFVGTGSTSSGGQGQFIAGVMSTGAIPASIAISNVSYTGQNMWRQPWAALVGS